MHELAHLRRRDDWTNLLQKILGALLFFHPAVWWIEKKLALEREMACDDLVLASTTSPRAYAECLVSLAEKSFLRRGLALAQAAVDRLRNVSLRVSQILDVDRPRATRVWRPAPVLVGGVSLVCLVALSHAPTRLVSFSNGAASSALTSATGPSDFEASQISHMGAQVIPAKLQIRPEDDRSEKTVSPREGSGFRDRDLWVSRNRSGERTSLMSSRRRQCSVGSSRRCWFVAAWRTTASRLRLCFS